MTAQKQAYVINILTEYARLTGKRVTIGDAGMALNRLLKMEKQRDD